MYTPLGRHPPGRHTPLGRHPQVHPGPLHEMATEAGGRHPTGMHSCQVGRQNAATSRHFTLADPRWGARYARPHGDQILSFPIEFSTKNLQNNRLAHPLRELAPPSGKSWIRHSFRTIPRHAPHTCPPLAMHAPCHTRPPLDRILDTRL